MNTNSIIIQINHKKGIHARPSSKIVKIAQKYKSTITIYSKSSEANAQNILEVLTLDVQPTNTITIKAEGPDSQEALNELKSLIDNNFYMEE